jgi:POT family proton-dependent oligopeptide transporter
MKRRTWILSALGATGALVVGWGVMPPRSRLGTPDTMLPTQGDVALNGWIKIAQDGSVVLAINPHQFFFIGIGLNVVGTAFFKPNISSMVGSLYPKAEKNKLDTAFTIFYMGINIGAFVCNFFAAYLRNNFSWGHAFAAAGVGMFIGVIVFALGNKHYAHADVRKPQAADEMGVGRMISSVLIPAIVTGIAGWFIPGTVFGSDSTDAFIFGSMPVITFYLWIYYKASAVDKQRIKALLAIYAVVIVFWAVFKQNGTALTTWAEFYTDRTMPAAIAPLV